MVNLPTKAWRYYFLPIKSQSSLRLCYSFSYQFFISILGEEVYHQQNYATKPKLYDIFVSNVVTNGVLQFRYNTKFRKIICTNQYNPKTGNTKVFTRYALTFTNISDGVYDLAHTHSLRCTQLHPKLGLNSSQPILLSTPHSHSSSRGLDPPPFKCPPPFFKLSNIFVKIFILIMVSFFCDKYLRCSKIS